MDAVRFKQDIRVTIQQIGHNGDHLFERADDVASVAYWYQEATSIADNTVPPLPGKAERRPR